MSKLEKLIQQYCPDGVEWKHLEEFCEIKTGKGITKKDSNENGTYPIISGGVTPMGYYHIFNREGRTVTISRVGANAGLVSFIDKRFYLNDKCFSIIPSNSTNTKFLYYILSAREADIKGMQSEGGVPTINTQKVGSIEIPLPPLPVQEEIVRVLDSFTELQAELQAELQKRKQQYNFYRDNLLNFKNINRGGQEIKWMKIGEICNVITGGEVPVDSIKGDTPQGDFKYPIWGNGKDIYGYSATYQITQDAVCISSIGANTGAVFFHSAYFTPIIRLKVLIPLSKKVSTKYLFYILSTIGFDVKKSSVPNMNSTEVKQKRIPIPPLAEQNRIVAILDRFDTLTTDLTQGLPAEIEKRRQQYEFYRDKLLTFKRKEA